MVVTTGKLGAVGLHRGVDPAEQGTRPDGDAPLGGGLGWVAHVAQAAQLDHDPAPHGDGLAEVGRARAQHGDRRVVPVGGGHTGGELVEVSRPQDGLHAERAARGGPGHGVDMARQHRRQPRVVAQPGPDHLRIGLQPASADDAGEFH